MLLSIMWAVKPLRFIPTGRDANIDPQNIYRVLDIMFGCVWSASFVEYDHMGLYLDLSGRFVGPDFTWLELSQSKAV